MIYFIRFILLLNIGCKHMIILVIIVYVCFKPLNKMVSKLKKRFYNIKSFNNNKTSNTFDELP